ncbi:MAG: hypothetical protein A2831_02485 [Candidatus Yanofskybacteria bacterium RIFCSPHIGHO2_01_FULL_44_17]|uniref:SpoVT-AbrB domain-containing protein n=1 Tax=Candidatus Yanofskybacteria bacterium RIFCSPHIGHO2_01_FULL_44_17 TaxID=1802668 RepID=A0A1F8EZ83_9BACT|nr:MAG: hypothetical protein A2831_02485 [Candidatus Yanofskybacteria bacterium RIFCSPHIGHO2_01_FULL_44_17]
MGRRKEKDFEIRKLARIGGGSLSVTLPIELVTKLGWREKQKVVVKYSRGRLIISDWRPSRNG